MFIPSLSIGAGLNELGGGLATVAFLLFIGALMAVLAYLEPRTISSRSRVRRNPASPSAPTERAESAHRSGGERAGQPRPALHPPYTGRDA